MRACVVYALVAARTAQTIGPGRPAFLRSPTSVPCYAGRAGRGPRLGLRTRRRAKQKHARTCYAGVGLFATAERGGGQSDGLALTSAYIYRGMGICTTPWCEAGSRFSYKGVLTPRHWCHGTLVGILPLHRRQRRRPGSDALRCVSLNESCPGRSAHPSTGGLPRSVAAILGVLEVSYWPRPASSNPR